MPNLDLSHPPMPLLWRGKSPGLAELTTLLGCLPSAGLVLDRDRGTISLANSALVKLTAFTLAELTGALVTDLIPDLPLEQLRSSDELNLSLIRHNREAIEVVAQVTALDNHGAWLLITLVTLEEYQENQSHKREMDLRKLLDLARLTDEPDLEHALMRVVDFTRAMFATDLVCVYQADGEIPRLLRVCSGEPEPKVFPTIIPSTDLIRLAEASVWIPGKRVQAEIHRHARISGLTYLASTPLGEGKGLFGLLFVGDTGKEPTVWLLNLLEVVGAHVSMAIQHFTLSNNLRDEVEKHHKLLINHSAVFENSSEGIIVLSPDLTVLDLNPAAEWMLGYANAEVRGQAVENILIGPERLIPALESACRGIPTHNMGNVSLHRRTGAPFPAHVQTIPVQHDGVLQAVIVFLNDVSVHEQIRVRTQQLEHRAILGDVSAVFAHEVRNPINNISTGLQLIVSRLAQDDPNLDVVNRMEADCTRLNHLMDSVLSFSRPMEPKFEPVDAGVLLRRMLDRWRPRMTKVKVDSFFQVDEKTPRVNADPRGLEQVFTNLISNAVDAMAPSGGTLAVRIAPAEEITTPPQVEIIISDNGPGIPDDVRERMFEPFVTNKPQGTGLGLAITKRILTAHHGSIKPDSFPGGTVFHVFIPAYQGD